MLHYTKVFCTSVCFYLCGYSWMKANTWVWWSGVLKPLALYFRFKGHCGDFTMSHHIGSCKHIMMFLLRDV